MKVELLRAPPISGSVPERHYEVSARANEWVRFEDDEGRAWVGVFGSAELANFSAAVPFPDDGGRTVLVIAGGQGYVVDAVSGTLLRKTRWDYANAAVAVPGHDFLLVANTTEIWAAERTGDRYVTRSDRGWYDYDQRPVPIRVALDGIVFERVTSNELTGRVWEMDGWYAFRVDVPTLVFTRGAFLSDDWKAGLGAPPAG